MLYLKEERGGEGRKVRRAKNVKNEMKYTYDQMSYL
jgi:hypothetical protein